MKVSACSIIVSGLLACLAAPVLAQDEDKPTVYGRLGAYFPTADTDLRVDALDTDRPGTEISFTNDLGFDKNSSIFEADVGFNISDAWAIEFEYFSLDRSSTAILDRQLVVEGNVYDANAQVTAGFEGTLYHLKGLYRVADWNEGEGEVQLSLGVHATDFVLSFEGEATVNASSTEFVAVSASQLAPLPTLGVRARQNVASGIAVFAQAEIFDLKVGDYDGRLLDTEIGASWYFTPNFGVGGSWRFVDYRLEITGENLAGRVDYELSGPSVFAMVRF